MATETGGESMNKSEIAERARELEQKARDYCQEQFGSEEGWQEFHNFGRSLVKVERAIAESRGQAPIIKQALLSANEWAAKFPLSETDSKPDYNAASVVYLRTSEGLALLNQGDGEPSSAPPCSISACGSTGCSGAKCGHA